MTLRLLSIHIHRVMDQFGFCVLFGVLSGVSIGELHGKEWTNGMTSALMAIVTAVLWNASRAFHASSEHIEKQRRIIAAVFEDISSVRDEMVAQSGRGPKG